MSHTQGKLKTKEQLELEIRKLNIQLNKIKDTEDDARNATYLGRCFKTRNNYSCPQKPSDYWWLYVKVTSVKNGIKGLMFQVDYNGRIEIQPKEYLMANTLDSYTPISSAQWDKAWFNCLIAARTAIAKAKATGDAA